MELHALTVCGLPFAKPYLKNPSLYRYNTLFCGCLITILTLAAVGNNQCLFGTVLPSKEKNTKIISKRRYHENLGNRHPRWWRKHDKEHTESPRLTHTGNRRTRHSFLVRASDRKQAIQQARGKFLRVRVMGNAQRTANKDAMEHPSNYGK